MDNLKNIFKKIFLYNDNSTYNFILSEPDKEKNAPVNESYNALPAFSVSNILTENVDYIKVQYSTLINSDIIMREFTLYANSKKYNAVLVFIDGMVNSELINNFLLKPLMQIDKKSSRKKLDFNGITVQKSKKIDLSNYIYNSLVPQNSIKKMTDFKDIFSSINSGDCALLIDTLNTAFVIDVKGFQARNIDTPNNELVVRGSQEAFVEKIRTNTSMLRRIINTENLIIENTTVGKITKTKIAICYIKNVVNPDLVAEVKYRINNVNVDYILSSGQLEQLIQDNSSITFPQMIATERPDKAATHLLEGRVVVLVNGSPYSLIMPGVLIDFLSSPEDWNLKHQYSNLLKIIRIFAAIISLLLPGFYVAVCTYHTELLPTELLFAIATSRNSVPFPVIFEIILMEISFEIIREAGLRIPTPIGPTIGIIGALVLGDAAVAANLVSPILIIIVAITGICSFSIPDFYLSFTFRIFRFAYIFLSYMAGFLGIAFGLFIQLSILASLKSFGVSYLSPYIPVTNLNTAVSYFVKPIWKREHRADFLNTERPIEEPPISLKWKFKNK